MPDLSWPKQRKLLRAAGIGFNAEVYRHFNDVDDTPANKTAKRKTLRDSLLIGAKDSRSTALAKIQYFRDQVQKTHLKPTIIGQLKTSRDAEIVYRCQVQLYFQQDLDAVPVGEERIDAEISFRLEQSHETITKTQYETLATKIKADFATPNTGYTWDKGKHICWYKDEKLGYDFQVYALSETEGENVIKKVMGIRAHTFDSNLFKITTPKKASDNTPGNVTILTKSRKKPKWRPTAKVRFQYANLIVWNVPDPICLVDRTGMRPNPVLRAY